MNHIHRYSLSIFFFLSSLEAFWVIFSLFIIPADPKNAQILGLSLSRAALLIAMLFAALLLYYLGWHSLINAAWINLLPSKLTTFLAISNRLFFVTLFSLLSSMQLGYFYYLVMIERFGENQATFYRLAPIILWCALLGLQGTVLFVILFRERILSHIKCLSKKTWLLYCTVLSGILVFTFWIGMTGIGLIPDDVAWGAPGTPLLFWQVFLAIDLSFGFLLFTSFLNWKTTLRLSWQDGIICLILWLSAVILWQQTPLTASYFAPTPVPPNYEFYPFSDAALHDVNAQYLLIGEGLGGNGGGIIRRPLYSLFLAALHILGGQNYNQIVFFQILFLACMAVLLYLMGASLQNRFTGILCALLFIIQEHNAILLSGVINVSHSKLLMSDAFTAFGVILFSFVLMLWFSHKFSLSLGLLAGGVLGATMLVRPQASFLAVVFLFVLLAVYQRNIKWLFIQAIFFCLGLLCVISPWLLRNWQLTHTIVFDEPSSAQIGMIAQRYSLSPKDVDFAVDRLEGEKEGEYSARMTQYILTFVTQHPLEVANFTIAHFTHNIVNLINTFPLTIDSIFAEEYVRTQPYWLDVTRESYQVKKPYQDKFTLGLLLFFFMLGIGTAIKNSFIDNNRNWLGILPFLIYLAYNLSNAFSRNSGWRFLLPGDWVGFLYYAIGICFCIITAYRLLSRSSMWILSHLQLETSAETKKRGNQWLTWLILTSLLLLFGTLLPLSETMFPLRYPDRNKSALLQELSNSVWAKQNPKPYENLERMSKEDNVYILWGRALYPRFYHAGLGITSGSPNALTRVRDYDRLSLYLAAKPSSNIILPISKPPSSLPNGSDVIVMGCDAGDHLSAYLIAYANDSLPHDDRWQVITQDIAAVPFCQ